MNETIRLGITLMIITLIAGVALGVTNNYTSMYIEKQKMLALKESLSKVMLADSFDEKNDYYDAYDKDKKIIGRVIKVQASGYSSIIHALAAIDTDNKIMGIDVISQGETPGLGTNIEKDSFLSQFKGKDGMSIKIKKDGGSIDAITGATISSRAITNGIRDTVNKNAFNNPGEKQ